MRELKLEKKARKKASKFIQSFNNSTNDSFLTQIRLLVINLMLCHYIFLSVWQFLKFFFIEISNLSLNLSVKLNSVLSKILFLPRTCGAFFPSLFLSWNWISHAKGVLKFILSEHQELAHIKSRNHQIFYCLSLLVAVDS